MAFSPLSFLLGLSAGYVVPIVSRNFRPVIVEAAAMGLGLVEDLRRIFAEQLENLEDIAAEARARREELAGAAEADDGVEGADESEHHGEDTAAHDGGGPRRRAPRSRSRRE